jgi:hypothetical protein
MMPSRLDLSRALAHRAAIIRLFAFSATPPRTVAFRFNFTKVCFTQMLLRQVALSRARSIVYLSISATLRGRVYDPKGSSPCGNLSEAFQLSLE